MEFSPCKGGSPSNVKKNLFIAGLKRDLLVKVDLKRPSTFEEAVQIAEKREWKLKKMAEWGMAKEQDVTEQGCFDVNLVNVRERDVCEFVQQAPIKYQQVNRGMYKDIPKDKRESIAIHMMPTQAYKDCQGFNEFPTSNGVLSDVIHGPRVQAKEDFAEKKFMPTKGGDSDVTPCFAWLRKPIDEVCLSKGRRGVIEDKGVSKDDGIQKHDMIAEEDMGVIEEIKDVGFCVPKEDPLAQQEEISTAY